MRKIKIRNMVDYMIFLIIPLSLYLIFFIYPNISSYVWSFFDNQGFLTLDHFRFVGFKNFVTLFSDPKFVRVFTNTLKYTVAAIVGQNIIALTCALLLFKKSKIHEFFKALYYLPAILSSVAIGFTWGFILDPNVGILNVLLRKIGLDFLAISWLGNVNMVMFTIAGIHIWQGVGTAMIIFVAGLLNIPRELYESAEIEGANWWQTFKGITWPLLLPTTLIIIVLTTIGCFKSFDYVYIMTGGGGDGSSNVLATWLHREAFQNTRYGFASAIAVILSITVSIIAIMQLRLYKEK